MYACDDNKRQQNKNSEERSNNKNRISTIISSVNKIGWFKLFENSILGCIFVAVWIHVGPLLCV